MKRLCAGGRFLLARGVLFLMMTLACAGKLAAQSASLDPNGVNPAAPLTQGSDGNFYGTTSAGGANGAGTVFQITPAGVLTTLYTFTGKNDGSGPEAGLTQGSDGSFYGTTYAGGDSNVGTVFRITPAGFLTILHAFTGLDGANPYAGLTLGSDGNFYGSTYFGGPDYSSTNPGGYDGVPVRNDSGTVFKLTPAGVYTVLHTFSGGVDGAQPEGGLTQGSDGNFYGTTSAGDDGPGTVFEITPAGILSTLHNFTDGADGGSPISGLTKGNDGNFYGAASYGGSNSEDGTIFKITPAGVLSTLYTFTGGPDGLPGGSNPNGLALGSDGNFYGTTAGGFGTVFEITPAGVLATLYYFIDGPGGGSPEGGLTQGSDGNFYGTTFAGGNINDDDTLPKINDGTVFKITPAGVLTTLYTFGETDLAAPSADLLTNVSGRQIGEGDTVVLTCNASTPDGSPIQHVNFYANGTLFASLDGNGNPITSAHPLPGSGALRRKDAAAPSNKLFEAAFQVPINGVSTQYNLLAIAINELGASQTSGTATVTSVPHGVDQPPIIALAGISNGQHLTAGGSYTATTNFNETAAKASAVTGAPVRAPSAIAKIEYYLDKLEILDASVNGGTVPALTFTAPSPGQYILEAISTDTAGVASVADPINVQIDLPVVTVSALGGGKAIVGSTKGKALVSRTGDTSSALTVFYRVTGSAVQGVDYKATPGTLVIPAGSASAKIKIKPIADPAATGSLIARIKLRASTSTYALGLPFKAKISILQH